MTENSLEIRNLSDKHKAEISSALLIGNPPGWKKVMGGIPSSRYPHKKRFNHQDMNDIEQGAAGSGLTPMHLLLEEWGTMGKTRFPNVKDLLKICLEEKEYTAASYINEEILNKGDINEENAKELLIQLENDIHLDYNPIQLDTIEIELENDMRAIEMTPSEIDNLFESDPLNSDRLRGEMPTAPGAMVLTTHNIPYDYLHTITNGFTDVIGQGGYATVFKGTTNRRKLELAIKRLKVGATDEDRKDMERQLNYEVDQFERLKHPNIIELLGFSNETPDTLCLIYPYMAEGTLKDVLVKCKTPEDNFVLSSNQRIVIMKEIAEGLNFLHSCTNGLGKPLIHRDVKSPNVLLDKDKVNKDRYIPKLADFGLLRHGVSGEGQTATNTMNIAGTHLFMAPEANRGDVSAKMDVWSYGVVLLEILTNLPMYDRKRDPVDLVTLVIQRRGTSQDATDLFDPKANWDHETGNIIFNNIIMESCLVDDKMQRKSMKNVLELFCDLEG